MYVYEYTCIYMHMYTHVEICTYKQDPTARVVLNHFPSIQFGFECICMYIHTHVYTYTCIYMLKFVHTNKTKRLALLRVISICIEFGFECICMHIPVDIYMHIHVYELRCHHGGGGGNFSKAKQFV